MDQSWEPREFALRASSLRPRTTKAGRRESSSWARSESSSLSSVSSWELWLLFSSSSESFSSTSFSLSGASSS